MLRFSLDDAARLLEVPVKMLQRMLRLIRQPEAPATATIGKSTLDLIYNRLRASLPMTAPEVVPEPSPEPAPVTSVRLHPLRDVSRVLRMKVSAIEGILRLTVRSRYWPAQKAIGDDTLAMLFDRLGETVIPVTTSPPAGAPTRFTLSEAAHLLGCEASALDGILRLGGISRFYETDGYLTEASMALLHARLTA